MNAEIKFAGAPVEIKFDNFALFKLVSAGVNYGDLLLHEGVDEVRYCKAWAAFLGVKFDGDARAFINALGDSNRLFDLNSAVLDALERDGIVKSDADDGKSGGQ